MNPHDHASRFLVGPSELQIRRQRCEPAVHTLDGVPRYLVEKCNVCSSVGHCVIAYNDRYGIPIRTAMCTSCGLVYLLDRLTLDGYSEFYRGGAYRKLTSSFAGSEATIEDLQADQAVYARNLIKFLSGRVPNHKGARLLDVGGSSGQVAYDLMQRFGVQGVVLDPSEEEIEAARKLGLEGIVGSAETWDTDEQFEVVLLCRTIEHLFDMRVTIDKIRRLLRPDGLFYCDFLDFMELCRMTGHPQTVSKIDHCYWLTMRNAPAVFRSMGFEIVSMHLVPKPQFIGLLLRQCPAVAIEPMPWPEMQQQIVAIQQLVTEWSREANAPVGLPTRVRNKVARMARSVG